MYVSKVFLMTKNLRIDIHWLFSLENLTGSSIETYDSTNLRTKNLRTDIQRNDNVLMRISLGIAMKHMIQQQT